MADYQCTKYLYFELTSQSQTSQSVTQTMAQVAAIADKTSSEASNVATTFKDLLAVAKSLQDTVRQFKVE